MSDDYQDALIEIEEREDEAAQTADLVEYDAWTIWNIARGNPEAMDLAMKMLNEGDDDGNTEQG